MLNMSDWEDDYDREVEEYPDYEEEWNLEDSIQDNIWRGCMKEFCTLLGELLLAVGMFAVPILCTCSITLGWDTRVTLTLMLLTVIDLFVLFECVDDEVLKK